MISSTHMMIDGKTCPINPKKRRFRIVGRYSTFVVEEWQQWKCYRRKWRLKWKCIPYIHSEWYTKNVWDAAHLPDRRNDFHSVEGAREAIEHKLYKDREKFMSSNYTINCFKRAYPDGMYVNLGFDKENQENW